MEKGKVLVTGAAGHLGNVLVRELIEHGYTVRAMLLPNEDVSALVGLDVEIKLGDVLDPPWCCSHNFEFHLHRFDNQDRISACHCVSVVFAVAEYNAAHRGLYHCSA